MSRPPQTARAPRHGTRWSRAAPLVLLGVGAIGATTALVETDVLATYVTVTNQATPASFNTSMIAGQYVGFGMVPGTVATGAGAAATPKAVLRAGFAVASLDGFCLTKQEKLGPVTFWLKITAGNGTADTHGTAPSNGTIPDITAHNMTFDVTWVTMGNQSSPQGLALAGMDQIGLAAPDVTTSQTNGVYDTNPLGAPTAANGAGWTGIGGTAGSLNHIKGVIYSAQIQGDINLPHLAITTSTSGSACNDPAAPFAQ